jgi:hypothetical protein
MNKQPTPSSPVDNNGTRPQDRLPPTAATRRVSSMDFHTATNQAVRDVQACPQVDSDAVHAALRLAAHAWQLCEQPGPVAGWDLFGTGLQAALTNLPQPEGPIVILIDERSLPDTEAVRRDAARLAASIASRLDAAAGDPGADPNRRWAWSTAAARLRAAAEDLLELP